MLLDFHTGPTQSSDMMDFKELTSTKGSNIGRAEVKKKNGTESISKIKQKDVQTCIMEMDVWRSDLFISHTCNACERCK